MNILIACEYSGIVRDAFLSAGHNAISCDLLPTESKGPHYQGDVMDIINDKWDMMIAHPPCTYLANSGVRWLHEKPGRWEKMQEGADFFRKLLNSNIPKVCVENPVIHKYAREIIGERPTMTTQPWEHGEGQVKRICFWLRGLPVLKPSNIVEGREAKVFRMPPSENRQHERSRFFVGVALAMADQWG